MTGKTGAAKTLAGVRDVRATLKEGIAKLSANQVPSPALAAELLLMHALACDRVWLYAHAEETVEPELAALYSELVKERAAGTPVQYLTGQQEFWGLEFEVTPAVLIPRPETEHVVEVVLERLGAGRRNEPLRIADVGTGSACIAVALASELPAAEIFATDISPAALEVARRNAARHNLASRIQFLECNLLGGDFRGPQGARCGSRFLDAVVSNPPYVPLSERGSLDREVRAHEPEIALFAGEDGMAVYPPLIRQAANALVPGGILVLELGHGAEERVRALVETPLWTRTASTNDLAGIPRVLAAERTEIAGPS